MTDTVEARVSRLLDKLERKDLTVHERESIMRQVEYLQGDQTPQV